MKLRKPKDWEHYTKVIKISLVDLAENTSYWFNVNKIQEINKTTISFFEYN